jgi:hypothetical protein
MTWLAILMALTTQAAPPPLAPQSAPPVPPLACVDAKGAQAQCGRDPSAAHECRAADGYGRCPDDPKCFDERGAQVVCVRPVVRKDAGRSSRPGM